MENRILTEQIVARGKDKATALKKLAVLILCAALLIAIVKIPRLSILLPVLVVGVVLISVAVIRSFNCEFEYSLSDDMLTVDIIRGGSRRSEGVLVSLRNITAAAYAGSPAFSHLCEGGARVLDFSSASLGAEQIGFLAAIDGVQVLFILEPNEKMRAALFAMLPVPVRQSLEANGY